MDTLIQKLKIEIKKKDELSGISDGILEETISTYLKKNKFASNGRYKDKDIKLIVKDLRDSLRLMHGRFQISIKNREKDLKSNEYENILKSHRSTNERMNIYPKVRELVSSLHPSSILDIASGLNPLAMADKSVNYLAIDINKEEIELISSFFKKEGISGKAICSDAKEIDYAKLGFFDLCLIFKFLDFIEDSHKNAEFFLKAVNCKIFLISFATKSISGKNKRQSRRIWFERILNKLNYNFELYEFENEIFYLIKK